MLLRKLADRAGLTAGLGSALARSGRFPLVDRGVALVSMAVAIVLGATSMSDIALLDHHAAVLGTGPSGTTVRRTLELADTRTLDKIARVRARVRAHMWSLICARPGGFPWLIRDGRGSDRVDERKRIATFALDAEVRFASARDRAEFTAKLASAFAARGAGSSISAGRLAGLAQGARPRTTLRPAILGLRTSDALYRFHGPDADRAADRGRGVRLRPARRPRALKEAWTAWLAGVCGS